MDFITAYESQKYEKSLMLVLYDFKTQVSPIQILMLIKNTVALADFQIRDTESMKQLVFWYFFIKGSVDFSNAYSFKCLNEKLGVNLDFFSKKEYTTLSNFRQYFDFGKNEIFLNRIVDTTKAKFTEKDKENGKLRAENIFDFFILSLHENLELYSLEGEHFPLFKWLINELSDTL